MYFKTILAVFSGTDEVDRMIDHIRPFEEAWDAHLIGVHAEPSSHIYATPGGFPDVAYIQAAIEDAKERAEDIKKKVIAKCDRDGHPIEWRSFLGTDADNARSALSSAYRADLVVAMQNDPAKDAYTDIETLLFESGRPVLLIPYVGRTTEKLRRVLVAWNGQREAARAVFDAIPFMKLAEEVEIFAVDPADTRDQSAPYAGSEIAAALARHEINVSVNIEHAGEISIASAIENRIADWQADLLVMGAYGHSRLREIIFGGTTRTILSSMPCMTLMSH